MWFDEFFGEFYVKVNSYIDWERADEEANFIRDILELSPLMEILDLPCGFGRHAISLTRQGFKVTGMEKSVSQINRAKEVMEEQNVRFPIIKADMRDIPAENKFDRAYNYFSSFGYFNEEENINTIREYYKALKPEGFFLLDVRNRDWFIKNFRPSDFIRRKDGSFLIDERNFDLSTSRINGKFILIEPDISVVERSLSIRIYSIHELIKMFKDTGFEIDRVVDGKNNDFTIDSQRIVIVARKY